MFHYVIALFFVSTCSRSFGNPLPNVSLSSALTALAARCENSILTAQINSKLAECSVVAPPYNEKQFECLIFYDINSQLCDGVAANKVALTENHTSAINQTIDVEKLCALAAHWNVMNITQYPKYKNTVEKVFNNAVACAKVCGVADILDQDANFFCKYYKWGYELLTHQVVTVPKQVDKAAIEYDIKVPSSESAASIKQNEPKEAEVASLPESKSQEPLKVSVEPVGNNPPSSTNKQFPSPVQIANVPENIEVPEKSPSNTGAATPEGQVFSAVNVEQSIEGIDKPSAAEVQVQTKKEEGVKLEETLKVPEEDQSKNANIEKSKLQNADLDDYQDSDEGKDGLTDIQGGDDAEENMLSDPDIKQDVEQTKITVSGKRIEAPMSSFNGDIDMFPNTIQDGFSDDNDHFFSVFMTAVILVVVLYILYHNKSKVGKVFFGLVIEGRQSGRRRNSRGHAYRRLDTLEQAMSSNTAAPPSKIIY